MKAESRPRPHGPLVTRTFVLVMLSTFAYYLALGITLPTLPRYVEGPLQGGNLAVGLAVGAFTFTALLVRPFAGRVGDSRGRKILTAGGSGLVALSVAGYIGAASVPLLVVARLVTGVGEAMFFTGAASAVNDLAPEERRGEAVSYFSLALYAGVAVGPTLGETVLGDGRFAMVWTVAALCCAGGALLALLVRDTRPRVEAPPTQAKLINRAALLPGLVLTTSVWGFSVFAAFVPLYALELHMSGSRFVFLLYSGIVLAVRLFGAKLPDRLGIRRMATTSLALSIAGLLLMGTWGSVEGLLLGASVLALGQSLAFPALMTMAVRGAPASERASVVGTFTAFFDLGYGVGAATMGGVAAVLGYRGAFLGAAVAGAAGLILILTRRSVRERATAEPAVWPA